MSAENTITVLAGNCTGLGASLLMRCLINALVREFLEAEFFFELPVESDYDPPPAKRITIARRPRSNARRLADLASRFLRNPPRGAVINITDIPYWFVRNQVLLLHRPGLLATLSGKPANIIEGTNRLLLRAGVGFVHTIAVQSNVMDAAVKRDLNPRAPTIVVPHMPPVRVPEWQYEHRPKLTCIYPARAYPHKNHSLVTRLNERELEENVDEILLTVDARPASNTRLRFLGELDPATLATWYARANVLLFLSELESYGLPLVEAMLMGMPIIAPNLPYATWLVGDEGCFFEIHDGASLASAFARMRERLSSGWRPDYSAALGKVVEWSTFARRLVAAAS